jgi:hypothetical protein
MIAGRESAPPALVDPDQFPAASAGGEPRLVPWGYPPVRNSAECRDMAAQFAKLADEAGSSSNERVLFLHLSSSWSVLAWVTEFLEQQDFGSASSFRSGTRDYHEQ